MIVTINCMPVTDKKERSLTLNNSKYEKSLLRSKRDPDEEDEVTEILKDTAQAAMSLILPELIDVYTLDSNNSSINSKESDYFDGEYQEYDEGYQSNDDIEYEIEYSYEVVIPAEFVDDQELDELLQDDGVSIEEIQADNTDIKDTSDESSKENKYFVIDFYYSIFNNTDSEK